MQIVDIVTIMMQYGPIGILGALVLIALYIRIFKWLEFKSLLFSGLAHLPVKKFKRSASAATVEKVATRKIEEFNSENPEHFLPVGKLELRRTAEEDDWEEDGKVFIVLKEHQRVEENLLNFGKVYVEKYVMRDEREYLDSDVCVIIDASLLRRFLSANTKALHLWNSAVFEKLIKNDDQRMGLWDSSVKADEIGLLTRFIIPEYHLVALRMAKGPSTSQILVESKEFLKFVGAIAGRDRGDPDVPLGIRGQHIKVGVVIVGQSEKIVDKKLRAHVWAMRLYLDDPTIQDVFILAAGPLACWATMTLVKRTYRDDKVERMNTHVYRTMWRGADETPAVLIQYVKGVCIDEELKVAGADDFVRKVKSEISDPHMLELRNVDKQSVHDWISRYGRKHFHRNHRPYMNRWASEQIANLLNEHEVMMEDMHDIFSSIEISDLLDDLLHHNGISYLHFFPEVFVKVKMFVGAPIEGWVDELNLLVSKSGYKLEAPKGFAEEIERVAQARA